MEYGVLEKRRTKETEGKLDTHVLLLFFTLVLSSPNLASTLTFRYHTCTQ